jgi:hypothetical protein
MIGPDGPEQRIADDAEYYEGRMDAIERIEQRELEDMEDSLYDIAEDRLTSLSEEL